MITIGHMNFELVEDSREAFNEEEFTEKYSELLNKYDYIVGVIGYGILRLAVFNLLSKEKIEAYKRVDAIEEYLNEYCNFGCAYFIIRKMTKAELKENTEVIEEDA